MFSSSLGFFTFCFLVAIGSLTLTSADDELLNTSDDSQDGVQLLNIILKSRTPQALRNDGKTKFGRLLTSFSWNDCGHASDTAHLKSFSLLPDPLRLPGNVTFGFQWQTGTDLTSPISLDLKVEKYVEIIWVQVPCHYIPGGCHHADICKELSPLVCPKEYPQCHCPFKKGTSILPSTTIQTKVGGVPSGDYRVTAWLKQGNVELGCVFVQMAVA